MTGESTIVGIYDLRLVTLSILIAIFASYATLDLAGRVTEASRKYRILWLASGSIAMGTGIWAMHYVAMAAYRLPIRVYYDLPSVVVSLLTAIVASSIALYLVSQPTLGTLRAIVGGVLMGGGIASMHYIGMEAMRMEAMCHYSPGLVVLSVLFAIAISYMAIYTVFTLRNDVAPLRRKLGGAVLLGLAIPITHYVGMWAVTFNRIGHLNGSLVHAVPVSDLGLSSIALATILILGTAVYGAAADRQIALHALQVVENQAHVQKVFDHLEEGLIVLDRTRTVVEMNKAALRLLELDSPSQLFDPAHRTFEMLQLDGTQLPEDQWPSALALKGQFVKHVEMRIRLLHTNRSMIIEAGTAPVYDHKGQLTQVILSFRDVTGPRQLDEARSRLAAIVECSEDAIIGKDTNGTVTSWNSGAERIFGYTAEEMIGQSIRCLLPKDRIQEEDEILARIRRGETVSHFETTRRRKNGQFIHISLTISPIKDQSGKIVGASKIARNITDRKLLESRLIESQKMEAVGQLTGGIAHDFNNLLSIVIGNLDLLERMSSNDPKALKRVETALKAANRGADLTRRLLAFSSREELRPALVRIEEPIENTIELASGALRPEIRIITNFDPKVPPIYVDVAGLESVLLNLMVNARDAMPKGGTLTITTQIASLTPEQQAGLMSASDVKYASVSISDTGNGMSRETLERAFEPFFTTKERGKGTGLGLAMVYGFFKQSRGAVHIYSELGYGTTVTFYLPIDNVDAVLIPAPVQLSSLEPNSGAQILLVDDEPDLLEIASSYLTKIGCTVLQAADGKGALEIIKQKSEIELVITDIIMPGGMNGAELSIRAQAYRPDLKFIFCSGFPAGALAERDMPPVNGPLLRKPYHPSELIALVQSTLSHSPPLA